MTRIGRKQVAYHEAGHAVMAHTIGRGFRSITIVAHAHYRGCLQATSMPRFQPDIANRCMQLEGDSGHVTRLRKEILMAFGGPVALSISCGRTYRFGTAGDDADLDLAREYANCCCSSEEEAQALLDWLRLRAINIMRRDQVWAKVEGLTQRLLEVGKMNGQEVRECLTRAVDRWMEECRQATRSSQP